MEQQTPYRVEFKMHGTQGAFARMPLGSVLLHDHTQHAKGSITWTKYSAPALVFSQLTACLILQGADLRNVFTERAYAVIANKDGEEVRILDYGPFYLLKGSLSPVHEPPLRLRDVVLARLQERPKDTTNLEIVTHLIMSVCPP
jgi:hypothetical protein